MRHLTCPEPHSCHFPPSSTKERAKSERRHSSGFNRGGRYPPWLYPLATAPAASPQSLCDLPLLSTHSDIIIPSPNLELLQISKDF